VSGEVELGMVGPFIFRCPATGLNVQHILDDEAPETGDARAYVGVRCLACSGIHLVSRKNGRLISDKADE
jgi:hypothetical protein